MRHREQYSCSIPHPMTAAIGKGSANNTVPQVAPVPLPSYWASRSAAKVNAVGPASDANNLAYSA